MIYEDFYKAYNPKGADKLGIVYTPNEIVRFMIASTDYLLYEHFGKELLSKNVEILDPATGTGTYITDLIDYFPASKKAQIQYKYEHEIHANEVSILPYYIANLNIEFAYQQKMKEYKEFENLVFVDTLDNMAFGFKGKQTGMFTSISAENLDRIKRQNAKKISVIIGNPPYNANQQNENDNNKNREYFFDKKKKKGGVDGRIKETYIKLSTAQKTKQYDMYKRFIRWASDRVDDDGLVVFVVNRSFIDKRQDDGFRKSISKEFDYCYIYDLGGDLRSQGAEATDNVFGIMIGVAIIILAKSKNTSQQKCKIYYYRFPNMESKQAKLELIRNHSIAKTNFELIMPDKKGNWINQANNDFEDLIPLCSKDVKLGRSEKAIFQLYSNGVSTNRDEWVYDFDKKNLVDKMQFFFKEYNSEVDRWVQWKKDNNYKDIKSESNPVVDKFVHERNLIKWSSRLKRDKLRKHRKGSFDKKELQSVLYRPFTKKHLYYGYIPIDLKGEFLKLPTKNNFLSIYNLASSHKLSTLVVNSAFDLAFLKQGNGGVFCLPLYRYNSEGQKIENITDWALDLFRNHYEDLSGFKNLTGLNKESIFHYVYGVLHNPAYRKKYEQNLKRDFPRIPLYQDFAFWAEKGKQLMDLHLNYDSPSPLAPKGGTEKTKGGIKLTREHVPLPKNKLNTPRLKADKEKGIIYLDQVTRLEGVPSVAFEYKLGNRSALEWVLDQYKEKKPRDKTIASTFNTYRFADYKEQVIDLLQKVCTVSIKTMEIIKEMEKQ